MTLNAAQVVRTYDETSGNRRAHIPQICTTSRSSVAAHLEGLRENGMRLRYRRNETIFAEHDVATHIYYVAGGCIRLCRHIADGRRHISEFMFVGDVLGLGDFPDYPYSAEAVNSVTVIAYPRSAFDSFGQKNAQLHTDLMAHFSNMLTSAHQRLFRASCQNARERTASFILQIADQVVGSDRIDLPMGRQEIADHLGLTIETVCRALAAFRAAGTIEIPNAHQLIIKRPDELCAIAQFGHTH